MVIQKNDFSRCFIPQDVSYIVPIPAGMQRNGELNTVSRLLVKDAHDLFVDGRFNGVIFLGSKWPDFSLTDPFPVPGAEVRQKEFMNFHRNWEATQGKTLLIPNEQMIVIPRGLETMNKAIALRGFFKGQNHEGKIPNVVILAPDSPFANRIDVICEPFFDFGQLANHIVVIMGYERELDDANREKREELLLDRTKKFLNKTGLMTNPQLRDETTIISEEDLVKTDPWLEYREDCSKILRDLPVMGKESPYVGIER